MFLLFTALMVKSIYSLNEGMALGSHFVPFFTFSFMKCSFPGKNVVKSIRFKVNYHNAEIRLIFIYIFLKYSIKTLCFNYN
jgi:hypothetical protein